MITEEQKYRAYTFNFAGFALITPSGKLILDALDMYKDFELSIFSIGYILFCFGLSIVGLWSIARGRDILDQ